MDGSGVILDIACKIDPDSATRKRPGETMAQGRKTRRNKIALVPPWGSSAKVVPIRGVFVVLLAVFIAAGISGYFVPYSRFSVDKVKLTERRNLRNVNHDLLERIVSIRRVLGELQGENAQLKGKHEEAIVSIEKHRSRKAPNPTAYASMGIEDLYSSALKAAGVLERAVAHVDSSPLYFESVPMIVPVPGNAVLSARFGPLLDPFTGVTKAHNGMDLVAAKGSPVIATASGTVVDVRNDRKWGLTLRVRHEYGFVSVYAHLASTLVPRGARVKKGQQIATVGMSGLATGPHLHYEVLKDGSAVDPEALLFPAYDSLLVRVDAFSLER